MDLVGKLVLLLSDSKLSVRECAALALGRACKGMPANQQAFADLGAESGMGMFQGVCCKRVENRALVNTPFYAPCLASRPER